VTNARKDLSQIVLLMGKGKVRPVVDFTFSFRRVPDTFARHKKGSMAGKILIDAVDSGEEAVQSKEVE
jgi:D-arabinose 1-dehydrogenase-like Zn-dependent alcohol dehydrogenase